MEYLFANTSVAEMMGKRGQQAVLEKYNWNSEAVKLINFYNKWALLHQ